MNLHDCHFLADDQRPAAKGDENLAHYDISYSLIRLAEVNPRTNQYEISSRFREPGEWMEPKEGRLKEGHIHKTDAKDLQAQHREGKVFESTSHSDDHGENDPPEA